MKRIVFTILLATLLPVLGIADDQIITYQYYLNTGNSEGAVKSLKNFTEEKNGYVKFFSEKRIILRIPPDELKSFAGVLALQGYIADEQVYRKDVGALVLDLKTKLKVKEKLLKELYALFSASKFHQTLDIEKEIGKVVMEIENLKGQINYYKDRTALSEVTVYLNESQGITERDSIKINWDWIKDLGIPGLMGSW